MKSLFVAVVMSISLVAGCFEASHNRGVLEQEKFVEIYVELLEARKSGATTDSTHVSFNGPGHILGKFEITEEQFQSTKDAYHKDPSRWKEFYELVVKRLDGKNRKGSENGAVGFNSLHQVGLSGG